MFSNNYHPNLQPKHGRNGIGNLEHDNIITYLNQNKKLNCGASSEQDRKDREKKQQKKKIKDRLKHEMTANVNGTRFEIVKSILESVGFKLREDEIYKSCHLIWTDCSISQERLTELKSYQRINHFMGMVEISRKDFLAKKFAKMQKLRPRDYDFFPKTWLFPQESNLLFKYIQETKKPQKKKYFILKPANGAMGMGIRLFSEDDPIKCNEPSIVQEYIDRPCLLDGYKNDFRIYVLITCCDPLRVFIYREGLVRLSTEKYVLTSNLKSDPLFMHLTNYSVNKKNVNYTKGADESSGSKRSLSSVMTRFKEKCNLNTDSLWKKIIDIIVKTLILVQPHLIHNYRMCRTGQLQTVDSVSFEILGFDILLDENLCPWLLEVNRSPSFGMDEALDRKVKGSLLIDTLRLINIKPKNKEKDFSFQKEKANKRLNLAALRTKIEPHLDNASLKKRKEIEKRKQDLIDLLVKVQISSSREYFENRHVGNFSRIFPPDDKSSYDYYAELLVDSFTLFNQLNSQNNQSNQTDSNQATQQMLQSFMHNQFREEDILEQIKECEKEENQILEKFKLPQNAELTTIIPKMDFYDTSSSDNSTSSEDSDSEPVSGTTVDGAMGDYELSASVQKGLDKESQLNRGNLINYPSRPRSVLTLPISKPKTESRSNETPKSTPSAKTKYIINKTLKVKEKPGLECLSNRANPVPYMNDSHMKTGEGESCSHDSFYFNDNQTRQKDYFNYSPIYEELLKILLTSLNTLSIRYPGQSESQTKAMLSKIHGNWDQNKRGVFAYWLISLNAKKRDKIINIVKNNVNSILEENFKFAAEISAKRLNRLLEKVYNRLLWNRGHGLIQCFTNNKSWQLIFSNNVDQIKPLEIEICCRIVQLCLDCVLIVHQFSISLLESDNSKSKSFREPQSESIFDSFNKPFSSVHPNDSLVVIPSS